MEYGSSFFRIGSFELRYYGVLFALVLAAGYFTLRWRYRDENEDPETATNFSYVDLSLTVIRIISFTVGERGLL